MPGLILVQQTGNPSGQGEEYYSQEYYPWCPVMDQHLTMGRVVILLITLSWVSCDGLVSHPGRVVIPQSLYAGYPVMDQHPTQGRVVILLVTLCWVSCDGLASHPTRSIVILLVTLSWVSCDGLASHPGWCNSPSHFMLGILCWTTIPPRKEYSNTPCCFIIETGVM